MSPRISSPARLSNPMRGQELGVIAQGAARAVVIEPHEGSGDIEDDIYGAYSPSYRTP